MMEAHHEYNTVNDVTIYPIILPYDILFITKFSIFKLLMQNIKFYYIIQAIFLHIIHHSY